jgi:hypothetical protein
VRLGDWLRAPRPWGPRAPDQVGEIRAWRVWVAVPVRGELALHSFYAPLTWPPGEIVRAECRRKDTRFQGMSSSDHTEPPPAAACSCGIYGVDGPGRSDIRQFVRHPTWSPHLEQASPEHCLTVLGEVALWGRVRVGRYGWRAEFARPLALALPPAFGREQVRHLAELYEIPLVAWPYGEEVRPGEHR